MKNRSILLATAAAMGLAGSLGSAISLNREMDSSSLSLLDFGGGSGIGGYKRRPKRTVAQDKRDARKARNRSKP